MTKHEMHKTQNEFVDPMNEPVIDSTVNEHVNHHEWKQLLETSNHQDGLSLPFTFSVP